MGIVLLMLDIQGDVTMMSYESSSSFQATRLRSSTRAEWFYSIFIAALSSHQHEPVRF
jgi:hypothetical protein